VQHEVTFTEKKTAPEKKEQDVNGIAQYTDDALSALPKELQDAVKLIQKFVADQQRMLDEANQRKNEIQATNQEEKQENNERQNEQIDNQQEQNLDTQNITQQQQTQIAEDTANIINENGDNRNVTEINENNQEQVDNNAGEINENTQEQNNHIAEEINANANLLNEDNIIPAPPTDQQENNQNEIDLVYIKDGELHMLEIKSGTSFNESAAKGFRQLDKTNYLKGKNAVVCSADRLSALPDGTLLIPVSLI
jgi:hypothetical protein